MLCRLRYLICLLLVGGLLWSLHHFIFASLVSSVASNLLACPSSLRSADEAFPSSSPLSSSSPTSTSTSTFSSSLPPVAVCFFGRTRSLRNHTFDFIQKYLLSSLHEQGFRSDVFLHTYSVDDPLAKDGHVEFDREAWRMLRPVAYEVEDLREVDTAIDYDAFRQNESKQELVPSEHATIELVRQLRSVRRCWDLVEKHINDTGKPYRYVMLARSDARYAAPGLPHLDSFCLRKECRYVSGAGKRRPRLGVAYEDRFVVGVPEVVKLWATRDELALFYVDHYQRSLDGETFSRWSLLWHDVEYVPFPFCFERIRATGEAVSEDLESCHAEPAAAHRPPPVERSLPGVGEELVYEDDITPMAPTGLPEPVHRVVERRAVSRAGRRSKDPAIAEEYETRRAARARARKERRKAKKG